jgi:hypothetical protein
VCLTLTDTGAAMVNAGRRPFSMHVPHRIIHWRIVILRPGEVDAVRIEGRKRELRCTVAARTLVDRARHRSHARRAKGEASGIALKKYIIGLLEKAVKSSGPA